MKIINAKEKLVYEDFELVLKSINNSEPLEVFKKEFKSSKEDLLLNIRKVVQDNLNVILLSIICVTIKEILLYQLSDDSIHYNVSLLESDGSRTYIISVTQLNKEY